MRPIHVRLGALVAVVACASEPRGSPLMDSSASVPAAPAPITSWRTVVWQPYAGVDPADLGIGVAFLRRAEDKGATAGTDTLILRAEPSAGAPAVGALLFRVNDVGVTSYELAAPDSLRPNLAEYGYEESGVPFDSTDASGQWVRGIAGFAADSSRRTGWIDVRQRGVGVVRWTEQLVDRPIFFARPDVAALFASPDSTKPLDRLPPNNDAYDMNPLEVRGPWMKVQIATPSLNCEPDSVPQKRRTGWIRYLDARGRPNVWYYTRGC
jgi:hypothetical protein